MTNHHRYSPTPWPGALLPLPRLRVASYRLDDDGWISEVRPDPRSGEWFVPKVIDCPTELHLREYRDTDYSDPQSLFGLVAATGSPIDPLQSWVGLLSRQVVPRHAEAHSHRRAKAVAKWLKFPQPDFSQRPVSGTHLAEIADRVAAAQLLVRHVSLATLDEPTAPIWQQQGLLEMTDEELVLDPAGSWEGASAEVVAWNLFTRWVNDGLVSFTARLDPPVMEGHESLDDIVPSYQAVCLLLYNDIVDNLPYRRCADETCRRLFRNQIGRAVKGSNRSQGVMYCSPTHARNQAQRDRRRAQRADTTGSDNG